MNKFTAILLLLAYLCSTTELYQLLKLPMVFEHFAEHQKLNNSISFAQFLEIHYMHGSPKDQDYKEDMKLPFKTPNNFVSVTSPVVIPRMEHTLAYPVVLIPKKEMHIPIDGLIPSSYLSNVWQPPKSC